MLDAFRPLGRRIKAWRRRGDALVLDPVRRVTRVALPPGDRVAAMTFDDGPTAAPPRAGGDQGLTMLLAEALESFGAAGTFNVIGSTAGNYPDRPGRPGSAYWNGLRYDHYPAFGRDREAGLEHQPDLARRLAAGGHELSNHSYRHLLFGPKPLVYWRRAWFSGSAEVLADLHRLHEAIRLASGREPALARPPHYVDVTRDGWTAYDLYDWLGYTYLAASFDGGGWLPSTGSFRRDVEAMVEPLRRALDHDPDGLRGQIIFQKDGYNMSGEAPVAEALPRHLEVLHRCGYRVVTVSELLDRSPFADVEPDQPAAAAARRLVEAGFAAAYRDNTVRPDRPMTAAEAAVTMLPRQAWLEALAARTGWTLPPRLQAGWMRRTAPAPGWPGGTPGGGAPGGAPGGAAPAPGRRGSRGAYLYAQAWAFLQAVTGTAGPAGGRRQAPQPAEPVSGPLLAAWIEAWLDAAVSQGALDGAEAGRRLESARRALPAGSGPLPRGTALAALAEALAPDDTGAPARTRL